MASTSEHRDPAGSEISEWIHIPTKEPLSSELRAAVVEDIKESWHFGETESFRRVLKAVWIREDYYQTIKDLNISLEPEQVYRLCNKLTAFYWMPSPELDGRYLPTTPFGCIYKEWIRYHNGRSPIELQDYFAHLVRVYPTGPKTIQEIILAHRYLCQEAVSLLERIERGEIKRSNGHSWPDPRMYRLNPIYHGIIIMMDQYIEPYFDADLGVLIDIDEQAQQLTVLLVRTGDDSDLCAPINFEELVANGLCLPGARSDIPASCDNVVRVSLATAVKFVSDLHQREVEKHPQMRVLRDWESKAQRHADGIMEEADVKGIDNVYETWTAVRRVKAAQKGELFEPREPYPVNRLWK